jgi:hypothetical protein
MRALSNGYRTPAAPSPARRTLWSGLKGLPDREFLVVMAAVWPAFLALVVRTLLRGETFGAGATVGAAVVVAVPVLFVSAWSSSRKRP